MDFQIQVAREKDYDFIFYLNKEESFSKDVKWIKDEYIQRIKEGVYGQLFIIHHANQPVGFYGLKDFEDHIRITKIFLIKSFQGKGFGTSLMRKIQNGGKELELGTHTENKVALKFYKKNGFQIVAQKDHFVTLRWKPDNVIE